MIKNNLPTPRLSSLKPRMLIEISETGSSARCHLISDPRTISTKGSLTMENVKTYEIDNWQVKVEHNVNYACRERQLAVIYTGKFVIFHHCKD